MIITTCDNCCCKLVQFSKLLQIVTSTKVFEPSFSLYCTNKQNNLSNNFGETESTIQFKMEILSFIRTKENSILGYMTQTVTTCWSIPDNIGIKINFGIALKLPYSLRGAVVLNRKNTSLPLAVQYLFWT